MPFLHTHTLAIAIAMVSVMACLLLGTAHGLLDHTEVIGMKRAEGDEVLEAYSPQMFSQYVNMTYSTYKPAFVNGDKNGWQNLGFVCINPGARTYGGMGNLFLSMIGVQFFGMAIGRTTIANNALITDLFDHPDPRQKFSPLSNYRINKEMRTKIVGWEAKKLSNIGTSHQKVKFIGSHGVPALSHGFKAFSPFLPKLLPKGMKLTLDDGKFYHNLMCQGFVSWLFSRPTKRIQNALKKYKENFINKCDANNVPDIAIQVRTLDNIKNEFNSTMEECYVSCAVAKARAVQKELDRNICIFVTSNRVSTTDSVVENLNSILNTEDSSPFKFLYHQSTPPGTGVEIMHSGKMVEAGRHVESFPTDHDFSVKEDLMDWFLLGEAVHVIGSHGSTFLSTARLRIGNPSRHVFNPLQHDVSAMMNAKTNFKCHCEVHSKSCN